MGGYAIDFARGVFPQVLGVIVFRTLPVFGYFVLVGEWRIQTRIVCSVVYLFGAMVLHLDGSIGLVKAIAAYSWFVTMGYWVYRVASWQIAIRLHKALVFIACAFVFLVIPAIAASPNTRIVALVIGWDVMLSAYSYVIETRESKNRCSLQECLCFLLVNPVVVFPDRGVPGRSSRFDLAGFGRIGLGMLTMLSAGAIATLPISFAALGDGFLGTGVALIGAGILRFFVLYFEHSGLASVQIGVLKQVGYRIPERYHYPLAAKSPADFWRRWNVYVGRWAERYVFFPVAVNLARQRKMRGWLAKSLAVLAAFAVTGILHDMFRVAQIQRLTTGGLVVFTCSGAMVLIWILTQRVLNGIAGPRLRLLGSGVLRFVFWTIVALSVGVRDRM